MLNFTSKRVIRLCINKFKLNYNYSTAPLAQVKDFKNVPGPNSYPLIGNLFALRKYGGDIELENFTNLFINLHKKYGDIFKFGILSEPEVYVFNPESIKKVFQSNDKYPIRKPISPMDFYYEKAGRAFSLATANGEEWKKLRTAVNPIVVRPSSVHSYIERQNNIIEQFINYIDKKFDSGLKSSIELNNFEKYLSYLTFELITDIVFNKKIESVDESKRDPSVDIFLNSLHKWIEKTSELMFGVPIWKYVQNKKWKDYKNLSDQFFGQADMFTKEARDRIKPGDNSILAHLLDSKDKYGLSINEINSMISEFLFGGIDTTASSLHFLLYELGTNPKFQEELYQHVIDNLNSDKKITHETIDKMQLVKATLKEALRLYAVASVLGRQMTHDIELDGYLIPKGTYVNTIPYVNGRLGKLFNEPERFNPHRWIQDKQNIDPFSSLPFGAGSRSCVGKRFIKHYKVEYIGEKFDIKCNFNFEPDKPLFIRLIKRN